MVFNGEKQKQMIKTGTYDIICNKRGDTWKGLTFTVDINGTVLDLSNYTIAMQVKNSSNRILLNLTIGNGITMVDAVNGVFRIDPVITPNVIGTHRYDIEFTNSGVVSTYVEGKFSINTDITN